MTITKLGYNRTLLAMTGGKLGLLAVLIAHLLCGNVQFASALYTAADKVKVLTARDFNRFIIESDLPAMVEFYAPWCGHCKQLSPIYSRVADNLHGIVVVAAVDCDVESNKQLCGQYGVKGFPTLKIFPASKQKHSKTGRVSKTPEDYNGPRSAKGIADAATAGLTDALIKRPLSLTELNEFLSSAAVPTVLLMTEKKKTSTLFKSLSMRFRGRLAFAEIRDATGEIAKKFGVKQSPSLVVVSSEGNATTYEGQLKPKDLVDFLKTFAGSKAGPKTGLKVDSGSRGTKAKATADNTETEEASEETGDSQSSAATPPPSHPVSASDRALALPDLMLTDVDKVLEDDAVWLLAVYTGPEEAACAVQAVKLANAANILGSLSRVARLNVTGLPETDVTERGLRMPTAGVACDHAITLKPFGDQSEPDEAFPFFDGDISDAKALQNFVLKGFPDSGIAELTQETMHAFMTHESGGIKAILFTNKAATPPVFSALAGNIRLGSPSTMFATVHERETEILANFQVTKVPKLLLVWTEKSGEKDENGKALITARLQAYNGPLKYNQMSEFIRMMSTMIESSTGGEKAVSWNDADVTAVKGAQQANSTADFQRLCPPTAGLCVVGLLNPAMSDHPQRRRSLRILSLKWSSQAAFLWLDVKQQPDTVKLFGATMGDAPTAVIMAPRKRRFALLDRGLDSDAQNLDTFIANALAGQLHTKPLQEVQLSEPTVPADDSGGAALEQQQQQEKEESEAAMLEDEFDLSDLMGEETSGSTQSNADRNAEIEAQVKAEAEEKQKQEQAAIKAARIAKAASDAKAAAQAREERKRKREAAAAAEKSARDEL